MKLCRVFLFVTLFCTLLVSPLLYAQADTDLINKVDMLIHNHYMNGIDYAQARALGPDAIPYLVEQLNDPEQKEFWVNIIVTIGFIEDSSAISPLKDFLETTVGEVDVFTLRALLSVPFAIGCIASSGERESLNYLETWVDTPDVPPASWSYQNKDVRALLSEFALTGMAVSGRAEAREKLEQLQIRGDKAFPRGLIRAAQQSRANTLDNALLLMTRIEKAGRATIFNPQTNR